METTGERGMWLCPRYIRLGNIKAKVVSIRDSPCSHESIRVVDHGYEHTDRLVGVATAWDVLELELDLVAIAVRPREGGRWRSRLARACYYLLSQPVNRAASGANAARIQPERAWFV